MDPEEIVKALRKAPFMPFRLYPSDTKHYDIRHPDQIIVSRRATHIGIGRHRFAFQGVDIVSNVHITRIEPLVEDEDRKESA